jgi:GT2 family glycosyltransferase
MSCDGTCQQIRSKFSCVELIETNENRGFGSANNIGLRKALSQSADYVFLLNQDAAVECNTIENLINAQRDSGYDLVSPLHFNGCGTALDAEFANCLKESLTCESIFDILQSKTRSIYPTTYVNAAAWLLTKNCINKVGGFDPSFFMYGEDDNYLMRVRYHKMQIGICFNAKIYHDRDYRNDPRWEGLYKARNLAMLYFKDINKNGFVLLRSFIYVRAKMFLKDMITLNLGHLIIQLKTINYLGSRIESIIKSRELAKDNCAFLHN